MEDFIGAKIYGNNGELIRDYVPCVRMSDYKVGIYDKCGSVSTSTNSPLYVNINNEVEDFWYWDESWGLSPYEVRYHADEQVTLYNSTNVIDHTFENGVGTLTFNNQVTSVPQLFTNTAVKTAEFPPSVAEISNYCFQDCTSLTGITIPPRVTVIGVSEFMRCTNLSSVNFANNSTITQLWNYCFYNCSVLDHISLPDTITSIGASAFENCKKLTMDSLPRDLKTINAKAFRAASNINFSDIPSGVTTIGTNAFEGCSNLELSSLPDTLSSIGDTAFANCKKIKLSGLPDGITSVPSYIFRYSGLNHEFKLPNACTYIGIQAFMQSNVQITKLPDTITTINTQAFELCTLSRWDNGTINMPAQLKTLNSRAFRRNNLLRIVKFKSQPDSIATDAFVDDTGITDIYCPWNEGDLSGAPWGATNATIHYLEAEDIPIEDIIIDNKTIVYKAPRKDTEIKAENIASHEFENGVGTIVFNDPITSIPSGFAQAANITEIKLPENVTSIGSNAFYNCSGLIKAIMPDGITSIGDTAFTYCSNLELSSLPTNLSSIGTATFAACPKLALTSLPSGITTINEDTFTACSNLALTSLPPNLTTIEPNGFISCSKLALNSLPDSLTYLGNQAFYNCTNLALSSLPDSITYLGPAVFRNCSKLELSSLPASLTYLGMYAFDGSKNVYINSIPSSVNTIGDNVFSGNDIIKTITFEGIPSSIGRYAFINCTNLTDIYCPWYEGDISGAPWSNRSITIHYLEHEDIPIENIEIDNKTIVYKAPRKVTEIKAENVSSHEFKNGVGTIVFNNQITSIPSSFASGTLITEIKLPENVTTIQKFAFDNCSGLIKIIMPDEITSIEVGAFTECKNLELSALPASLSSIGNTAFLNCKKLALTSLPSGITTIEQYGFYSCSNLALTSLPANLTTIGDNAFMYCSNMPLSSLPESLVSIGYGAFSYCSHISFSHIPASVQTIGQEIVTYSRNITTIIFDGVPSSISNAAFYKNSNQITDIYCPWYPKDISGAPWGASYATIHYLGKNDGNPIEDIVIDNKTIIYKASAKQNNIAASNVASHEFENGIGTIVFNDVLTNIPSGFASGTFIGEIKLPESVATIQQNAFINCTNLIKAVMPDNLTTIDQEAFAYCSNLALTSLPANLSSIGSAAFTNCEKITLTSLPSGITTINEETFAACSNLALTSLPANIATIKANAFIQCINMPLHSLSESLTAIETQAFAFCANLALTSLPNSLTTIGNYAFLRCTNMPLSSLSNSLTVIKAHAFNSCTNLAVSSLPSSITYIENSAFRNCSKITNITFEGVPSSIHSGAFASCNNLTDIYCPWYEGDLSGAPWGATSATIHYLEREEIPIEDIVIDNKTIVYKAPTKQSSILNYNVVSHEFENGVGTITFNRDITTIYANFAIKTDITEIKLPESVTEIWPSAFYNCSGLTKAILPDGITLIGKTAFCNCDNLILSSLPSSLSVIGKDAFWGCGNMFISEIPSSVEYIYNTAFGALSIQNIEFKGVPKYISPGTFNYSDLTSMIVPWKKYSIYESIEYDDRHDEIYFNHWGGFNDITVTYGNEDVNTTEAVIYYSSEKNETDEAAFEADNPLREINQIISSLILTNEYSNGSGSMILNTNFITDLMFKDNSPITKIILSNNIMVIDSNTFYGLSSLTELELPNHLMYINDYAFEGCESLTSITFKNTPDYITQHAFGESNLEEINVPWAEGEVEGAPWGATNATINYNYKSFDVEVNDRMVAYKSDMELHPIGEITANIVSHEYVNEIGIITFNTEVSALTSKDPLKSIFGNPDEAYLVDMVKLPDSITTIEDYAFNDCVNLKSVNLADSITYIGDYAFANCVDLKITKLPNGIEHIGDNAFEANDNLKIKEIPSSINYIGENAFAACSIDSLIFLGTPTTIGAGAFDLLNEAADIGVPWGYGEVANEPWGADNANIIHNYNLTFDTIKYTATSKPQLYYEYANEANPDEDETVITSYIESHTFANGSGEIKFSQNIEFVNNYVLGYEMTRIFLPRNVKRTDTNTFGSLTNLEEVQMPIGMEEIKYQSFAGCENLSTAIIPNTVKSIEDYVMNGCPLYITLPNKLEYIGRSTFEDTLGHSTKYVSLSPSLSGIDYKSFSSLKLENITFNSIPKWLETTYRYPSDTYSANGVLGPFSECNELAVINVPWTEGTAISGSAPDYGAPWKAPWAKVFYGKSNYLDFDEIRYYASSKISLYDNYSPYKHTFANGVGTIGLAYDDTLPPIFRNSSITDINFGKSVNIGPSAFMGCSNLSISEIPSFIKDIDENAFNGCSSISQIYIGNCPGRVISNNAFTDSGISKMWLEFDESDSQNDNYPWGLINSTAIYNAKRIYMTEQVVSGYYINASGKPTADAGKSFYTKAISVNPGDVCEIEVTSMAGHTDTFRIRVHGYSGTNANSTWKQQLGVMTFDANTGPKTQKLNITIPANITYMRVSFNKNITYTKCWIGTPKS